MFDCKNLAEPKKSSDINHPTDQYNQQRYHVTGDHQCPTIF